MRIGFLSYDFFPPKGGQGVEAFNLYKRLSGDFGVDTKTISACRNHINGHISIPVKDNTRTPALRFSLKVNNGLKKLVSSLGLDLLQIYGGPGGVMLLRDPGIPVIYVANHTYMQQRMYLRLSLIHI